MSNLVYRGLKSSRARLGIALILSMTALLLMQKWLGLTEAAIKIWTDFVLVIYATYGLTEIGAKGAEAYQNAAGAPPVVVK